MWYHEKRKPRAARGGIKAQTQRGAFGASWWAQRWIEALERFTDSGRLSRGRSYARNGRVLSIDVDKGKVQAEVQGSSWDPYRVAVAMKPLSPADWQRIGEALAREAYFAAKLLAGEMPHEIDSLFTRSGFALFPGSSKDLKTSCSCPDAANPCKHVAAVFYLLGEEFDRDPFLIFKLRGLDKEELTDLLAAPSAQEPEGVPPPEPLRLESFWAGAEVSAALIGEIPETVVAAPLLRRLGSLPFWRGEAPWPEAFADFYADGSRRALTLLEGTEEPE